MTPLAGAIAARTGQRTDTEGHVDRGHAPQASAGSSADSARIPPAASRRLSPNSTPLRPNRHQELRSNDSFKPERTTPNCANSTNSTSSRHLGSTLPISLASLRSQTRRTASGQPREQRKRAAGQCRSCRMSRIGWRSRPSARLRGGSGVARARARPSSLSGSRACSRVVTMRRLRTSGDEGRCSDSVSSAVDFFST